MTKAISAVIATIMLLMITVSLIGVFYVFSSTMATQTTSSGSQQVSQLTSQLSYCMQVDNIYKNQITLRNCGKGVIENKSLVVMMDDVKLGASTQTITEGNSSVVNVSGLWQVPFGAHSLKISNGAAVAQNLVDVQPNKDGLVGSWSFNEGSGNRANDISGNGNIGTLLPAGSEPTWVSGKFNNGLQFDGVDDYVNLPDNSVFTTPPVTYEAWIRLSAVQNSPKGEIIESDNGAASGMQFNIQPDGRVNFIWMDGGSLQANIYSTTQLGVGQWYHIVAVVEPNRVRIFVNGIQEYVGSVTLTPVSPIKMNIGSYVEGYAEWFNGTIDEVRIWSRALVPDETVTMKQLI